MQQRGRYKNAFCGLKIHFTRGTLESSQVQNNDSCLDTDQQWPMCHWQTHIHMHNQVVTPGFWDQKKKVHLFCWVTNMTSDAMLAGSRPIVKVISLIKEVLIIPQLFRTWLSVTLTLLPAQEPHLICPSCVILCTALSFHVQHAISAMNEIKLQQLKMRAKSACVFPLMG